MFGINDTEVSDVGAAGSVLPTVETQPVGVDGVTNLFKQVRGVIQQNNQNKKTAAVGAFQNELLSLVHAVDQGQLSASHARSRMRLTFMKYNSDYPSLAKEFGGIYGSTLSDSGMGQVIPEGLRDKIRNDDLNDSLVASGFISPNATPEEKKVAQDNFVIAQEMRRRLEIEMDSIDLELKKSNLSQQRRTELETKRQKALEGAIFAEVPIISSQMSEMGRRLAEQVKSGELKSSEAQEFFQDKFRETWEQAMPELLQLPAETRNAIQKSFEDRLALEIQRITGSLELEEYTRDRERMLAEEQAIILGDDRVRRAVAASTLSKDLAPFLVQPHLQQKMSEYIIGNLSEDGAPMNPFSSDGNDEEALRKFLEVVSNPVVENTQISEEQQTHLQKLFEGIEDYEGLVKRDPAKANALVNYLASPNFLKMRTKYPETFSQIDGAQQVLQRHYFDEVMGVMRNEFEQAQVAQKGVQEASPLQGGSRPGFVDSASLIEVVATEGGITFRAINSDADSDVQREVARLNRQVAPVFNRVAKAQAHLEGNNNYKSVATDMLEAMQGTEQLDGGDADDDLGLDQFSDFPQVSSEGLPADVKQDTEFMSEVERVSSKYEIDPADLLAVIDFETGGTFNPSERNKAGSSGTGLIQFMANTAKGLGTTTEKLASMSRSEQMQYVDKYLGQFSSKIRGASTADLYMAVLFPKAIDKSDDYVLFKEGTLAYKQNRGLDTNGSGTVTKAEAARKVVSLVGKHET